MNEPTGPKPTCIALGGCLGSAWCDYCGNPLPVSTTARTRLAAEIAALRLSLAQLRRRTAA